MQKPKIQKSLNYQNGRNNISLVWLVDNLRLDKLKQSKPKALRLGAGEDFRIYQNVQRLIIHYGSDTSGATFQMVSPLNEEVNNGR